MRIALGQKGGINKRIEQILYVQDAGIMAIHPKSVQFPSAQSVTPLENHLCMMEIFVSTTLLPTKTTTRTTQKTQISFHFGDFFSTSSISDDVLGIMSKAA